MSKYDWGKQLQCISSLKGGWRKKNEEWKYNEEFKKFKA